MAFSGEDPAQGCAACGHEHLVAFYETEEHLVATVADYLAPVLNGHDAAVVVATADHREAFDEELRAAGVDVDGATREGRYIALDAAAVLSSFTVGGAPERSRFREVIGRVLDRASSGGREVRVYGEMVALLWGAGDVISTMALEDLWNELGADREFSLFCGYPICGFDVQSRSAFEHICGQHSAVLRPPGLPDARLQADGLGEATV